MAFALYDRDLISETFLLHLFFNLKVRERESEREKKNRDYFTLRNAMIHFQSRKIKKR